MKSGSLLRLVSVVGLVLPVALAASSDADACGTAVYREVIDSAKLVAGAESALSDGNFVVAARSAANAFPALKLIHPGALPLADRALRILALASVRTDGNIVASTMKADTAADRAANLEWSIETIRGLSTKRGDNPTYQTDLGEALARVPSRRAEAAKILSDLAAKDLLTTAEGYAALARLRAQEGDAHARDAAVKRCELMTKTPKICQVSAVADDVAKS